MLSLLIYYASIVCLATASIEENAAKSRTIDFQDYVDVNSDKTLVSVDFENDEFSELLEDDYSSERNKDIAKKSADAHRMSDFERLRQAIRNGWVPLAKPTTKKPRTKIVKKTKLLTRTADVPKLPPVSSIVKNQSKYVATRTPVRSTTPQVNLVQDTPYAETTSGRPNLLLPKA